MDRHATAEPAQEDGGVVARRLILIVLLLAVGTFLRVHDVLTLSMDGDEFYSLEESTARLKDAPDREWGEKWRWRWVNDTHPLTHGLHEWAVGRWGPDIAALRRVSCGLGLLALILLPWCFSRVAGPRAGMALLALLALCPLHVQFARFARYQSPAFLFGGLMLLAVMAWLQRGRWWQLLLVMVWGALCVGSHLAALMLVVPLLAYAVLAGPRRKVSIPLVFLLMLVGVLTQFDRFDKAYRVVGGVLGHASLVTSAPRLVASLAYTAGPLLSLAALIAAFQAWRRKDRVIGAAVVAASAPLVLLGALSLVEDVGIRYYAAAVPGLLVLAARLVAGEVERPPRGGVSVALAAVICLASAPLLISDQRDGHRFDFDQAGKHLAGLATPDQVVLSKWHGILEASLGFEPIELQYDADWVRAQCLESLEPVAYVLLMTQRGHVVFPDARDEFQPWLDQYGRLLSTFGKPRLDRALYSFELRLYEIDVNRLAHDRGLD